MKIKHIFKNKKLVWGGIAVIVIIGAYFLFFNKKAEQETLTITKGDFLQQVSVSGKVASTENLDLSFEQSGIIRGVYVKTGDRVLAGKFIATQDTAQFNTQYAQMEAGIELQKAKLAQLLAGQSPQDLQIAVDKVIFAKQDLASSYQSALVTLNTSYNALYNASSVALYIRNTYFSDAQGFLVQNTKNMIDGYLADAKKNVDEFASASDKAITNVYLDTKNTYEALKVIRDQCDLDVYYSRVTAVDKTSLDTQKININTAMTNLAASQTTIASYKAGLIQAQNNLDLVKAPARETDIAVYRAQIKQAEAQAEEVETQIRKRQIFSPIAGVITAVNAKLGTIMGGGETAVSVISDGQFQIESYVPEIYISLVKVDNEADVTLDSYGADKVFKAKVISIDPSETVKDGVSTYKITLELMALGEQIRNGMTANVVITTNKKTDVISVPQGIIKNQNGEKIVQVKNGDKIEARKVMVGEISSNGNAEIVSGLSEGEVVIIK